MHTCVCMSLSGTWYRARSHCGSCHGLKPRPTRRETNMSFNTMFIMFMPVWFRWFLLCSWIEGTCLEIGTPLARRPTWRNRNLAVGGAAMSYCPSGPPESRHRDIWISGKVGGTHTRCLATSLHQKGYEAGYESVIVVGGWSLNMIFIGGVWVFCKMMQQIEGRCIHCNVYTSNL